MLVDPYARLETKRANVLDRSHGRIISNNLPEGYDIQECSSKEYFEQLHKSKRMRHYGDVDSGNSSASHSGSEENCLQNEEAFQKTKISLPVKNNCLPGFNELANNAKNTTEMFAEPMKSLRESKAESEKVVQSLLKENTPAATTMQNPVPFISSASDKSKSIKYASGNSESRPMQNEILDAKLKLHQVEKGMHNLHSKQTDLNNSRPIPPSGLQNGSKADIESRTIFVLNVHFAASTEALLSHFTKCGPIVKVNMLADRITGQPKGKAYIVFANKESVDKAISLSGTSFFSRILMVKRKTEIPPGYLAPTQPAMKLAQPWLYKEGPAQRHYSTYHFQWKRDKSANGESSISAQTTG